MIKIILKKFIVTGCSRFDFIVNENLKKVGLWMIDTNSQKNIILILKKDFCSYMSTAGYHGYSKKQMLARTRHVKNSEELIKIKRTYSTSENYLKTIQKLFVK